MNALISSIPVLVEIAGVVIALVVIMQRTTGRSRTAGAIGLVLMLVGFLSVVIFNLVMGARLQQVATDRMLMFLTLQNIVRTALIGAGVIVLAVSVVLGRWRPAPEAATPYPPSTHAYAPPQQPR